MSSLLDSIIHAPWWVALLVGLAGLAFMSSSRGRTDKALLIVGVLLVLVAIALGVLGQMFPSDVQQMEKRTRQIVAAVDSRDWTGLQSLLDTDTVVGTQTHNVRIGVDNIVKAVQTAVEQDNIRSIQVTSLDAKQVDTDITVSLEVSSVMTMSVDQAVASSWQLDYQQNGDNWQLVKITAINIGGSDADQVLTQLPVP